MTLASLNSVNAKNRSNRSVNDDGGGEYTATDDLFPFLDLLTEAENDALLVMDR